MAEEILESYLFKERLKNLLRSTAEASARTRKMLLFELLACGLILLTLFNGNLSWDNNFNTKEVAESFVKEYTYPIHVGEKEVMDYSYMNRMLVDLYFNRNAVIIPILGFRISAYDLSVIAPIILVLFTTLLFFTVRRENHVIGQVSELFNSFKHQNNVAGMTYLYNGIIHEQVFLTATKRDTKGGKPNISARIINWVFYAIPSFTITIIVASDIYSVIGEPSFFNAYWVRIVIAWIIAGLSLGYCSYQAFVIYGLDMNIEAIFKEQFEAINSPVVPSLPQDDFED